MSTARLDAWLPRRRLWGLLPPILLFGLLLFSLAYALRFRLRGEDEYDALMLREWVQEARVFRLTLPELLRDLAAIPADQAERRSELRESIQEHLAALGEVTRTYQTQLPLFPTIYSLRIEFHPGGSAPITWQSQVPAEPSQVRRLRIPLLDQAEMEADLLMEYQLHAYAQRQENLARREMMLRGWLSLLALLAAVIAGLWVALYLRGEIRRELEQFRAQRQLDHTQKQALEEQLRRQVAEHEREESERKLLEQKIATQEAERQALTLKSQLHANIGIMAGAYAHNIKNLMVRPSDLLQRTLEVPGLPAQAEQLLQEVQHTLQGVAERTQQILKTVRSDPTQAQLQPCELNSLLRELQANWGEMARQKWKARLTLQPAPQPLPVSADRSHLQQALENLLFNARDATFEKRARLRDEARTRPHLSPDQRRDALIAAAEWEGSIQLAARAEKGHAVLQVVDNGNGMAEEVQDRCLETHFTTKRGSALYEGNNTGMGLGLTFVKATVERHGGRLVFQSKVGMGTTFELWLPLQPAAATAPAAA